MVVGPGLSFMALDSLRMLALESVTDSEIVASRSCIGQAMVQGTASVYFLREIPRRLAGQVTTGETVLVLQWEVCGAIDLLGASSGEVTQRSGGNRVSQCFGRG